jgi:hypothetical protein
MGALSFSYRPVTKCYRSATSVAYCHSFLDVPFFRSILERLDLSQFSLHAIILIHFLFVARLLQTTEMELGCGNKKPRKHLRINKWRLL